MKKLLANVAMSATALSMLPLMAGAAPVVDASKTLAPMVLAHTNIKIKDNASSTYTSGVTPQQMRHAYGIDQLANDGSGQTIAIVDAYGSPTIQNDLNVFSQQFGIASSTVNVVDMGVAKTDGGWALETALDVEWAHALAPKANIMLVEAKSASLTDLIAAEDYATQHGAVVVSNSWGSSEFSTQASYDSHFQANGVVYVASAGDTGGQREWPAASPYIMSVGGTKLSYDTAGNYLGESAWTSSGGGLSQYVARPSYQSNVTGVVGTQRGIPDIGMDADPNSGAAVYSSTRDQGQSGWFQVGGTSLSAPMVSALIALADQSRTNKLSNTQAITDLYTIGAANYNDVTTGSNGNPALVGYDLVTGNGTPKANLFIPALISAP
ncbi:S53 family peptidase [Tumebacillus sp. ITR2]|uniref:S53 family peptidase n=1 Tax=Tumebacillus amylolyticus TaxID=2801339 RepID=A0ABS1J6C0_9BACL|nr:S53 family peptidase [Tumebacillus amylolyticus]MBL0385827.1 S53 family peptidase [Tumebacillus amylolyticus]